MGFSPCSVLQFTWLPTDFWLLPQLELGPGGLVLVFRCCVANNKNFSILQQHSCLSVSINQESRHGGSESSVQGFTRLQSVYQPEMRAHPRFQVFFQTDWFLAEFSFLRL